MPFHVIIDGEIHIPEYIKVSGNHFYMVASDDQINRLKKKKVNQIYVLRGPGYYEDLDEDSITLYEIVLKTKTDSERPGWVFFSFISCYTFVKGDIDFDSNVNLIKEYIRNKSLESLGI